MVSSSGGVLLEMLALRPWLDRQLTTWVCPHAADTDTALTGCEVRWVAEVRPGALFRLVTAIDSARRMLAQAGTEVVVSAGTGVAVPVFLAAWAMRIPTVWVETFNVIGKPGRAARLCGLLADRVLVQHEHLLSSRRRAVHIGRLY